MLKIAVLVSGGGTNLQAIIDKIAEGVITNTEIAVVISNNKNAYALERAKQAGIEAVCVSPKDYENREQFINAMHNSGQQDPIATIIGLIEEAATKQCSSSTGNTLHKTTVFKKIPGNYRHHCSLYTFSLYIEQ